MPRNGFSLRPRPRPGRALIMGALAGLVLTLSIVQVVRSWQEMSGIRPLQPMAGTVTYRLGSNAGWWPSPVLQKVGGAADRVWSWAKRLWVDLPLLARQAGIQVADWTQRWRSGPAPTLCGQRGCLGEISLPTHPPA